MPSDVMRIRTNTLSWAVFALALGVITGMAVVEGTVTLLAGALLCVVLLAIALWSLETALIILVFTMPLDIYGRILSDPVPLTVFQVVLIIALVAWFVRIIADASEWFRPSALDAAGAMLILAAICSVPQSLDPGGTIYSIVRLVFLWALMALYVNGVKTEVSLRRVYGALLVTAVLMASLGIAQLYVPGFSLGNVHVQKSAAIGGNISRASGFFEDPNMFAGYLSAMFVVVAAMFIHAKGRREALVFGSIAAITGAALLATFSRTGWVGAFVGCVAVVLTAPHRRRTRIVSVAVVAAIVVVLMAPGAVIGRAKSIVDIERDGSNYTRYGMYISTIQMIQDDWVSGTGLTAYELAYPLYRQPGTILSVRKPHQLPLALWAEMGIAGLMAEIVFIVVLVLIFWRRRSSGWTLYEAAALGGLVTLLTETLFQYYLYFEYVWLFSALALVAARLARADERMSIKEMG